MIDVALALEYLHFGHSTPIIHCNLKPSNVLLDEDMVAHISDFGIAKLLSGEDQLSIQIQTLATIGYMAPGLFEFTTYPLFSIISNLPNYWFFHDLLFTILLIII